MGEQHTCALLDDDTVKCWGTNVFLLPRNTRTLPAVSCRRPVWDGPTMTLRGAGYCADWFNDDVDAEGVNFPGMLRLFGEFVVEGARVRLRDGAAFDGMHQAPEAPDARPRVVFEHELRFARGGVGHGPRNLVCLIRAGADRPGWRAGAARTPPRRPRLGRQPI